jgi:hypothetical protein
MLVDGTVVNGPCYCERMGKSHTSQRHNVHLGDHTSTWSTLQVDMTHVVSGDITPLLELRGFHRSFAVPSSCGAKL